MRITASNGTPTCNKYSVSSGTPGTQKNNIIAIACTQGIANDFSLHNMIPNFSEGLRFLPIVIFNFHGFEIITAVSEDMDNPQKEIPKALLLGGSMIAFFYLFSAFGILVAVPVNELSTATGLMNSFKILLGSGALGHTFMIICGTFFLLTLISNLVAWATGVNYVAFHAAKNSDMPRSFKSLSRKTRMPFGAAIWNGVVASGVVTLYVIFDYFGTAGDLFWNIFSMNAILLMMAYILMFPAFIELRKIDPDRERPFKVKGGKLKLYFISYMPMCVLAIAIILFFYVPGVPLDTEYLLQVGVPLLAVILINELVILKLHSKK